ncbi:MAG: hypothetical protein AAGG59_00730 [Bacteroidota bacterium]
MVIDNEPIIAECPLEQGSMNKVCYLSFKKLFININGRIHTFDLSLVSGVSFKKKLLLLPLILGGIITPLSLIALINDLLHVWTMLVSFMAGVLLVYYGLEGRNTLSITTSIKEYDFFINSPSANLKAFVDFTTKIKYQKGEPRFYLECNEELHRDGNEIIDFKNGIELKENVEELTGKNIFILEPLSAGAQVTYKKNPDGKLAPYLTGPVRKDFLIHYHSEKNPPS